MITYFPLFFNNSYLCGILHFPPVQSADCFAHFTYVPFATAVILNFAHLPACLCFRKANSADFATFIATASIYAYILMQFSMCYSMRNIESRIARKTYLLTQISAYSVQFRYLISFIDLDLGVFSVGPYVRINSDGQNSSFHFIKAYAFSPLHRIYPPLEFRNFVAHSSEKFAP